jgi:hypothetical protein
MRKILLATLPLLLTACVNDSATYYADGSNNHTLSLRRQQDYFWNNDVKLTLLAARLPDCQRQIVLGEMDAEDVNFELFSDDERHWSLRSGNQVWQVETQKCTLVSETGPATGEKVGTFKLDGDRLVFEPVANVPGTSPAAAGAATPPAN